MSAAKRILVSWYTDPGYIPPFRLSEHQITVGPKLDDRPTPYQGFTPRGRYDLRAALEAQGLPTRYDAVVVWSDPTCVNQPLNLESFDCPRILFFGDTQHLHAPLKSVLEYASATRFDFIAASHNRQHLHWFAEAGYRNLAWLPGILVRDLPRPFSTTRRPEVCFIGAFGLLHPRRTKLLMHLRQRNRFPFNATTGTREMAAERYAAASVSLNCSLNGDLNMRVFEVLSAGGCLLTDRLSEQAGLSRLLKEGTEYFAYDSAEECGEAAEYLLAHPDAAVGAARSGLDAYRARLSARYRIDDLLQWVFAGRLDSLYRPDDLPAASEREPLTLADRIAIYECLQEFNRSWPSPTILFLPGVPQICIRDAIDLHQLEIGISDEHEIAAGARTQLSRRCRIMRREEWIAKPWGCVVAAGDRDLPQGLQHREIIRIGPIRPSPRR